MKIKIRFECIILVHIAVESNENPWSSTKFVVKYIDKFECRIGLQGKIKKSNLCTTYTLPIQLSTLYYPPASGSSVSSTSDSSV